MKPEELKALRDRLAELNRDIAQCLEQIDRDPSQPWGKRLVQLKSERSSIQNTLAQYD